MNRRPLPTSFTSEQEYEIVVLVARAIDTDTIQVHRELGLAVVPDTVLLQGIANGHTIPLTPCMQRGDGRTAAVFLIPEGMEL